jgi:hypothetical protein
MVLMRSRCCLSVCACVCVSFPIVAGQRLGKNFVIVASCNTCYDASEGHLILVHLLAPYQQQ